MAFSFPDRLSRGQLVGHQFPDGPGDKGRGEAWSHETLLTRIITHELGHVFGLPHLESTIMDEGGPEFWLVTGPHLDSLPRLSLEPPTFVRSALLPERCASEVAAEFFANRTSDPFGSDFRCVRFEPMDGGRGGFRVVARPQNLGDEVQLGEIVPRLGLQGWSSFSLVQVFLNPRQQVFNTTQRFVLGDIMGEGGGTDRYFFRSTEGWEKPIYLESMPGRTQVLGAETRQDGPHVKFAARRSRNHGDWLDEED